MYNRTKGRYLAYSLGKHPDGDIALFAPSNRKAILLSDGLHYYCGRTAKVLTQAFPLDEFRVLDTSTFRSLAFLHVILHCVCLVGAVHTNPTYLCLH